MRRVVIEPLGLFKQPIKSNSAYELSRHLFDVSGYEILMVQAEPGPYCAYHEFKRDLDGNVILGVQVSHTTRFVGLRNLETSCFCSPIVGSADWRDGTQTVITTVVAGFNTRDQHSFGSYHGGSAIGHVFFPRQKILDAAAGNEEALMLLETSNVCRMDQFRWSCWAYEINQRFQGMPGDVDNLAKMAVSFLLPEYCPVSGPLDDPTYMAVTKELIDNARAIMDDGADPSVEQSAARCGIDPKTFRDRAQSLLGMLPKQLYVSLQAESIIRMMRSDHLCQYRGVPRTMAGIATFLGISEAKARRLLKDYTTMNWTQLKNYLG